MAKGEEGAWVQLSTRVRKTLQRRLKLHCVNAETSVMDFVTKAIEEKLGVSSGPQTKGTKPYEQPPR